MHASWHSARRCAAACGCCWLTRQGVERVRQNGRVWFKQGACHSRAVCCVCDGHTTAAEGKAAGISMVGSACVLTGLWSEPGCDWAHGLLPDRRAYDAPPRAWAHYLTPSLARCAHVALLLGNAVLLA